MHPLVTILACAVLASSGSAIASTADPAKVLRVSSQDIASLDPQQGTDISSTRIASHLFEGLYQFDYLTSPAKVVPNTAEAMPQIAEGGLTWTIRLRKGILFHTDAAFGGKPRELTAQDYVYSLTRRMDPNLRTGGDAELTDLLVGARPVIDAAKKPGGRLDYDAPIEGLRALDRYTLQFRLTRVNYTLLERLAVLDTYAVAREAIEAAGPDVMSRPVGTGPYRLLEWRRGSRVVLEAHPGYRSIAFPESSDPAHRALVASMRGRKLPAIGRVEVAIIPESTPEFLSFDQGNLDIVSFGGDSARRVLDGNVLKPAFAKRGIAHHRASAPSVTFTYFNMEDPTVGGYDNAKVALRRAVAMGFDTPELIRVLFAGQATPANQLLPPGVGGHDPAISRKAPYDPAAARALLDRFGYRDRDGDGFREMPDGKPLVLLRATLPESWYREVDLLWKRNMEAIGLRMEVQQQTFAELLNLSLNGKLPMFNLGLRALAPSGYEIFSTLWGKATHDTNRSRFRQADFDKAFEAFLATPDGPDRLALSRKMSEVVAAYVPLMLHTHGIANVLVHPWVDGYAYSAFGQSWKYLDIDTAKRKAALR